MARIEKFREPLEAKWRNALVGNARVDRIQAALTELNAAVIDAQGELAVSPLTHPAAMAAAKELGKVGEARIVLENDGSFWLEVETKGRGGDKRSWSTSLPSLGTLRNEAETLGVDTIPMGRSKTMIIKALEAAKRNSIDQMESQLPEGTPRRRMMKTAPAVLPIPPTGDSSKN